MIRCASGDSIFRTWGLSYGVSNRMDTKISPPCPTSWGAGVLAETFSENHEKFAGV